MATPKLRLVQGDTSPQVIISVTDASTDRPIDLSYAYCRFIMRELGDDKIKSVIRAYPIAGRFNKELERIDYYDPYGYAGRGGRLVLSFPKEALDTAGEYEAELECTFSGGEVQTVYKILRLSIREQF